ncbi:MAG: pyrroline-5-carboxylate reductase [Legionellales bacterium]
MNSNITIIGAGHMATAIVAGLAHAGVDLSRIWITDKNFQKLDALAQQFSVKTSMDNHAAIKRADIVLLAIKPQSLPAFAAEHQAAFSHMPLIISILSGIPIAQLTQLLGAMPIVRAMPNILVSLSQGNTILFSAEKHNNVEDFFAPLGIVQWVNEEKQLDAYTILTGCGPGYLFFMMQSIIEAAAALGIDEIDAKTAVLQLFSGSAQMAMQSPATLIELQQQVASKGGVTEKILLSLSENKIPDLFKQAFLIADAHNQALQNHKE